MSNFCALDRLILQSSGQICNRVHHLPTELSLNLHELSMLTFQEKCTYLLEKLTHSLAFKIQILNLQKKYNQVNLGLVLGKILL